jgi:hypothetical protein
MMAPRLRKLALTTHVASSVGSFGAIGSFVALAITGLTNENPLVMRAAYVAMERIATLLIVPLVLSALVTGLIQALGTPWGLFRHWWVLLKLLVMLFVTGVLLLQLPLIDYMADAAAKLSPLAPELGSARLSLAVHAGGGFLVLLVPMILSIYKPRGLTPHGAAKQRLSPRRTSPES